MKKFLLLFTCVLLAACSSIMPYKDQNLDYLQGIEKDPNAYRGQVVSFGGEVEGITEDTLRLMLVMKIDAPLYYYATGKGNSLSYEMLLVTFNKRGMPQMTGIKKGNTIKVLARVSSYETRKNFTGDDIAVLHLIAFALSDHTQHRDFFRPETPDRQLYESWKEGKLFFEESAQDVINRCPKETAPQLPERFRKPLPPAPAPEPPAAPEAGIVFDEEEPIFVLDPQEPTVCPEQEPEPSPAPVPGGNASAPAGVPAGKTPPVQEESTPAQAEATSAPANEAEPAAQEPAVKQAEAPVPTELETPHVAQPETTPNAAGQDQPSQNTSSEDKTVLQPPAPAGDSLPVEQPTEPAPASAANESSAPITPAEVSLSSAAEN